MKFYFQFLNRSFGIPKKCHLLDAFSLSSKKVAFTVSTLKRLVWSAKAFNYVPWSGTLTALGNLSGYKVWSTVTLKHVDLNYLPQKKSALDKLFPTNFFDRVVYFLGAGHKQIVILLSLMVA